MPENIQMEWANTVEDISQTGVLNSSKVTVVVESVLIENTIKSSRARNLLLLI